MCHARRYRDAKGTADRRATALQEERASVASLQRKVEGQQRGLDTERDAVSRARAARDQQHAGDREEIERLQRLLALERGSSAGARQVLVQLLCADTTSGRRHRSITMPCDAVIDPTDHIKFVYQLK